MPGVTMAINPKAPTARKGPITSTPTPKVAAKAQQQRKTSVSQAVLKTQQQRKISNAQNSPKVVVQQQRKASATKPQAMVDNKRKIKAENVSPTMADLQVKPVGADKGTAQLEARNESPPKKQKVEEMKTDITHHAAFTSPEKTSSTTLTLATQLPSLPPSAAPQSTQMMTNLLRHVLQTQPTLLPSLPSTPITSPHIDAIAHTMWQIAFKHVVMLQRACQYSAMYAPVKLAALAKLNFLPSWWFFRDLVVGGLPELVKGGDGMGGEKGGEKGKGVVIDDGEMMGAWDEAVRWCGGVVARREGGGEVVGVEEEREREREREEQEGGMVVQEEGLVLDCRMVDGSESGEGAE